MASHCRIVIAGGGIAGLALALMLERFDIDYILLESHSQIAPDVGASIGMFPNGLRILDQLGCVDPIKQLFGGACPYNTSHTRSENGEVLSTVHEFFGQLEERHSYGLYFFDRQKLLQILHDKIQHKERILVQKKVIKVGLIQGGVEAICADGSVFPGLLLVGADGVHSAVRQSMTDLGHKLQPGYFDPTEKNRVPCYYRCSFGIAQHVPNWVPGEQHLVFGTGRSQLVASGPDDRVYWFMMERLPVPKFGDDIPRYSKEDEVDFVTRNATVPITTKVTFGDVFEKRLTSTLTPLHEMVYEKWFFKRVITLGDSAHKPNPIGGQGGNGALESCAVLVNCLNSLRESRGGSIADLTDEEVEQVFQQTQSARHERAKEIVARAHEMQALFANERPIVTALVQRVIQPLGGPGQVFSMMSSNYLPAAKIERLPVPHRPRLIPFNDELPATPVDESTHKWVRGAFVGSMGLTLMLSKGSFRLPFNDVASWSESNLSLKWFGNNAVSAFFEVVTSILAIPIESPSARLHLWSFLPQLISPVLIYTIEGYRRGNQGSALSLSILFNAGMQLQGIGRIAPLHAILSAFSSVCGPADRAIPLEVAQSLVPAVTLGFIVPTIMALAPNPNKTAWHAWLGLWQFAPPLVNILTYGISTGLRKWNRSQDVKKRDGRKGSHDQDVQTLGSVYTFAFAVQATAHIATLAYGWHRPGINLASTFFKLPNPFKADWRLPNLAAQLATFFRYDMALAVAAYVSGNLWSIWTLHRQGYIKTREALKAALGVVAGQLFVGPGATWAGLWYWRECKIAGIAQVNGDGIASAKGKLGYSSP